MRLLRRLDKLRPDGPLGSAAGFQSQTRCLNIKKNSVNTRLAVQFFVYVQWFCHELPRTLPRFLPVFSFVVVAEVALAVVVVVDVVVIVVIYVNHNAQQMLYVRHLNKQKAHQRRTTNGVSIRNQYWGSGDENNGETDVRG